MFSPREIPNWWEARTPSPIPRGIRPNSRQEIHRGFCQRHLTKMGIILRPIWTWMETIGDTTVTITIIRISIPRGHLTAVVAGIQLPFWPVWINPFCKFAIGWLCWRAWLKRIGWIWPIGPIFITCWRDKRYVRFSSQLAAFIHLPLLVYPLHWCIKQDTSELLSKIPKSSKFTWTPLVTFLYRFPRASMSMQKSHILCHYYCNTHFSISLISKKGEST